MQRNADYLAVLVQLPWDDFQSPTAGVANSMYEVIRNTTSQLIAQDLDPLIAYLRSLPPLPEEPK